MEAKYYYYFNTDDPRHPFTERLPANKDPNSLPPGDALEEAPSQRPGFWPCEKDGKWVEVEDNRGKPGFLYGAPSTIKEIGPSLPAGWSDTKAPFSSKVVHPLIIEPEHPFAEFVYNSLPEDYVIYHYCSLETFTSIIRNQEIWLTESTIVNDYTEMTWLNKIIKEFINEKVKEKNGEELSTDRLQQVVEHYNMNSSTREKYICCFSTEKDLLGQWRSYANDGEGVAIGIDILKLGIKSCFPFLGNLDESIRMLPVCYDEKLIKEQLSRYLNIIALWDLQGHDFGIEELDIAHLLYGLSLIAKNPTFMEEKEWRLIFTIYPRIHSGKRKCCTDFNVTQKKVGESNRRDFLLKRDYRATPKGLSPYFKLQLNPVDSVITEVVLGPKNQSKEHHVELFLEKYNFKNVNILRSKATYR